MAQLPLKPGPGQAMRLRANQPTGTTERQGDAVHLCIKEITGLADTSIDLLLARTAGRWVGDVPQGTLTSPEFQIVGPQVTFLIGGGSNVSETRAELVINGSVVHKAAGERMDTMVKKKLEHNRARWSNGEAETGG